jgi:GNAT superfamily N-acetyltransferase
MIVQAEKKDTGEIISLISELYLELGEEAESIKFLDRKVIHSILDSGSTEIYFLKQNSETAGIFTLTETQSIYAGGKCGILDELYIKPEYRNNFLGEKCILYIKEIAKTRNWNRIELTGPTDIDLNRVYKFYDRMGFVFTGRKLKFLT